MARRADMLTFTATLALVLLSVPSTYGQTAACINKLSECTSIVGSGIPDNNITALIQFCSSGLPNLTECVSQAKSVCTDPNLFSGFDSNLAKFRATCEGDAQCVISAAQCMATIQSSVPDFSSLDTPNFNISELQRVCPAFQQAKTCTEGLDAKCKGASQATQMINQMSGVCEVLADSGQCPGTFSCIASVADGNMNCSTLTTAMNCVKGQVQEGSCSVDQSGLSYSDLETMVNELCTAMEPFSNADYNCSALNQCVLGGFDVTQSPLTGIALLSLASRMASPKGLCRYIEIETGCYGSQASACGYTQSFVSAMTVQHTKFNDRCPKPDNGSTGQFVPTMLLSLAVVVALLFV